MKPVSPLWYLAAFVVALGAVLVATVVAAGAWQPVRDATVQPVTQRADAAGRTLAVFTNIVQPDRTVTCRGTSADGAVTEIPAATLDLTVDDAGTQWSLVGLLRTGQDGLAVSCAPTDDATDNASYGYAVVDGFGPRTNLGKGIAVLGVTAGVGLAALTFFCRRTSRLGRARALTYG